MLEQSGKRVVVQSNELIEASYSLNLNGKRLLLLAISKINPNGMPSKTTPLSFTISASDFVEAYPETVENAYRDLKRGAKELSSKVVTFRSKTANYKTLNLTDSVEYLETEGKLILTFGYSISHHLLNLVSQFTQFDLLSVRKLSSIYSIRLFELLAQYRGTGFKVETLDNLRFSLCIKYERYADLKRFVIQKAVDELNAKSSFKITYEPVRTGKAVTAVKFFFSEEKQTDMFKS